MNPAQTPPTVQAPKSPVCGHIADVEGKSTVRTFAPALGDSTTFDEAEELPFGPTPTNDE